MILILVLIPLVSLIFCVNIRIKSDLLRIALWLIIVSFTYYLIGMVC
jgi:hypothetical protein